MSKIMRSASLRAVIFGVLIPTALVAQTKPQTTASEAAPQKAEFSEADRLRGTYGPYRANNDLLYYHLDVRVDPEKQFLSGKNSIRFKMLEDGHRIQLDLVPVFQIDKILLDQTKGAQVALKYERAAGRTVYVDFPQTLRKGDTYTIE